MMGDILVFLGADLLTLAVFLGLWDWMDAR